MLVKAGQVRRWTGWAVGGLRGRRAGGVFIVLSERKTFVDALGVTHDVQDLAWNYLSGGQEEWQWDDVIVGSSEVVSD